MRRMTKTLWLFAALLGSLLQAQPPTPNQPAPAHDLPAPAAKGAARPAPARNPLLPLAKAYPLGDVLFDPVLALHQKADDGSQYRLRQGSKPDSDDWPATFYTTFNSELGITHCTAALVGPGAMLTAAHCISTDGKISVTRMPFEVPGKPHTATCEPNPTYLKDGSADWALCTIDPAIAMPANDPFETIERAPLDNLAQMHTAIVLGGYGCTSDDIGAPPVPGPRVYLIGGNAVAETSDSSVQNFDPSLYSPYQHNNLFTDEAGSNLCQGDSGGPAFRITQVAGKPYQHRAILAVNQSVFPSKTNATKYGASLLAATGGPDFWTWAQGWAQRKHQIVCGVWPAAPPKQCRQ